MKKIPKIDGCHHCPLRTYGINTSGRVTAICSHPKSDGRFITWFLENMSYPVDCPLPNDNEIEFVKVE